jgi:type VI protein secretion system component VasK
MSSEILAAGHADSGGAMVVMVAVVVLIALAAFGVVRWRQRRARAEQYRTSDDHAEQRTHPREQK